MRDHEFHDPETLGKKSKKVYGRVQRPKLTLKTCLEQKKNFRKKWFGSRKVMKISKILNF